MDLILDTFKSSQMPWHCYSQGWCCGHLSISNDCFLLVSCSISEYFVMNVALSPLSIGRYLVKVYPWVAYIIAIFCNFLDRCKSQLRQRRQRHSAFDVRLWSCSMLFPLAAILLLPRLQHDAPQIGRWLALVPMTHGSASPFRRLRRSVRGAEKGEQLLLCRDHEPSGHTRSNLRQCREAKLHFYLVNCKTFDLRFSSSRPYVL